MASVITNTCPRGGFFDGNENFGGPPYRGFMALLCFAPSMFLFMSAAWWYICYRKQRAQTPAPIIQNGNLPHNSNYQTMNDNNNNNNNNNLNIDLSIDDHPMIDDTLYYSSEPNSPHTSSSVGPMSSPSPQPIMLPAPPTPSPLPSSSSSTASNSPSSSNTASMSASLLTPASPSPSPYNSSFAIENNNSSISNVRELGNSRVSRHTRFLLFCRSLIRPSPLYMSTCIYSCIQFIITLSTLVYGIVVGEQCCYGGTGALYAILCLRLCLSYTNIRIGYWQTNSRYDTHITVIDKSCQIGYLIHFIWLAFAFILVADDGQCSATAPIMYTVSYISIILLLLNYSIFALFTIVSYVYHSKNDMMIVLSRTAIKFCLIGWAYGKELDLNDAITDIEMEIACLPCVTYDEMMQRENMKRMRRQMYDMEKNGQLTVKIDKMNTNNDTTTTDAASSSSSSSSSTDVEVETLSCAICLSAYESCDMIRPLPCGHHLHKSCSDSWLKVKSTCPLCVRSVLVQ